jgi:hypothetical protein
MRPSSGPKSPRRPDPHGWNTLDNYLKTHFGHLDRLEVAGDILGDTLTYEWIGPHEFHIRGRIICRGGLFVDVDKHLETNHAEPTRVEKVRTVSYSYHAGLIGEDDRCVFRYDNAHRYAREGHEDAHHKHRFDPTTWQEIAPPEWIGGHRWPHLNEVIDELLAWWDTTAKDLGLNPG